jgi:hypothetical protein
MKLKHRILFNVFAICLIALLTTSSFVLAETPAKRPAPPLPYLTQEIWSYTNDKSPYSNMERAEMNHQRDSPQEPKFLFGNRKIRFPSIEPDEELLHLEAELRQRQLLHRKDIQNWYRIASYVKGYNRAYAIEKLRIAIEADRIEDMRHFEDPFRPLGPEVLLRQGDLHLLDQVVDGVGWMVPRDALVRGTFTAGPQGAGKTRFIVWICQQLAKADPPTPFLIIDPKAALSPYAKYLNAVVVDISEISLDLSPPGNMTYYKWLIEYLPYLAADLGLIQSTDLLLDAGRIALGVCPSNG